MAIGDIALAAAIAASNPSEQGPKKPENPTPIDTRTVLVQEAVQKAMTTDLTAMKLEDLKSKIQPIILAAGPKDTMTDAMVVSGEYDQGKIQEALATYIEKGGDQKLVDKFINKNQDTKKRFAEWLFGSGGYPKNKMGMKARVSSFISTEEGRIAKEEGRIAKEEGRIAKEKSKDSVISAAKMRVLRGVPQDIIQSYLTDFKNNNYEYDTLFIQRWQSKLVKYDIKL